MIGAWFAAALAGTPAVEADLHGDLKSFFTATFPYDHPLMPPAPTGQGVVDGRIKLELTAGKRLRFRFHPTATALTPTPSMLGQTRTGVGLQAPEALPLTRVPFDDDLTLRTRIDRLSLGLSLPGLELVVGRQALSFGRSQIFTPLDLVGPFTPAFIDREYKPGVDAARADLYAGTSTALTLAAAYAGSWDLRGLHLLAQGQTTLGTTDVVLFLGAVQGDAVLGLSLAGTAGGTGLTADLALTLPADRAPFFRGAAGLFGRPSARTTMVAELYVQTLGSTAPGRMLSITGDPRFRRGEIWLMGVLYGAVAVQQELRPTVRANLAALVNMLDPSIFASPSVVWSVGDGAELVGGAMLGLGKRPDPMELSDLLRPPEELDVLNSEFGAYPGMAYLQVKTYF